MIGNDVVDLRDPETAIEVAERHSGLSGVTNCLLVVTDRSIGVIGSEDAPVAGREHGRVVCAVVVRVKDDRVLIRVNPTRFDGIDAGPPVGSQTPIPASVISSINRSLFIGAFAAILRIYKCQA